MIKEIPPAGAGATPGTGPGAHMNDMVLQIARLLKDRKARDIMVLDLKDLTSVTDYFIICTVTYVVFWIKFNLRCWYCFLGKNITNC